MLCAHIVPARPDYMQRSIITVTFLRSRSTVCEQLNSDVHPLTSHLERIRLIAATNRDTAEGLTHFIVSAMNAPVRLQPCRAFFLAGGTTSRSFRG